MSRYHIGVFSCNMRMFTSVDVRLSTDVRLSRYGSSVWYRSVTSRAPRTRREYGLFYRFSTFSSLFQRCCTGVRHRSCSSVLNGSVRFRRPGAVIDVGYCSGP